MERPSTCSGSRSSTRGRRRKRHSDGLHSAATTALKRERRGAASLPFFCSLGGAARVGREEGEGWQDKADFSSSLKSRYVFVCTSFFRETVCLCVLARERLAGPFRRTKRQISAVRWRGTLALFASGAYPPGWQATRTSSSRGSAECAAPRRGGVPAPFMAK